MQDIKRRRRPPCGTGTRQKTATLTDPTLWLIVRGRRCTKKRSWCYTDSVRSKQIKRIRSPTVLGKTPKDLPWGLHLKKQKPAEVRKLIQNHIESILKKETHYLGRTKLYLDKRLSVKKMHGLFRGSEYKLLFLL